MPVDESNCSPYIALTQGKNPEELSPFFEQFVALPLNKREIITSPDVARRILTLLSTFSVGEEYAVAIAKLVGFLVLGDVAADQVPGLLTKLGIANSEQLSASIVQIATPKPMEEPAPTLKTVPPLTVQRPASMGPNMPPRNIIDLRKPPETP
ncbi:MAG TPA: hypothetical protein VMU12_03210 [Candidatus Paceibacterota bacterium]|nr:hypothetical protein [Candidatus Paceibacterota bacterium]